MEPESDRFPIEVGTQLQFIGWGSVAPMTGRVVCHVGKLTMGKKKDAEGSPEPEAPTVAPQD